MTDDNRAQEQAAAQLSSIRDMLAALEVDYDRLEELREQDERDEYEQEEFAELQSAAGDCESEDEARERIEESPLSIQIRSGWYTPGDAPEPEEFEILLCTGGPAVRIVGELDAFSEPSRAWMEYQDWGTPWTEYLEEGVSGVCLEFARQFYYGE